MHFHGVCANLEDHSDDVLPCLLDLRHAFLRGQKILDEKSDLYKKIAAMPKVQTASNPQSSALALFLQTGENDVPGAMGRAIQNQEDLHILAYVFDGLYYMAKSNEHLVTVLKRVALEIYQSHGMRLALKSMTGEVMAKFQPPQKRAREADSEAPASQDLDDMIGEGVAAAEGPRSEEADIFED